MTKIKTEIKKKIFHIRKILVKKEVKVIPILLQCIMWVGALVVGWVGGITADTHHQLIIVLTVISWEGQALLMSLQGPVHPSNNRPLSSIQKLTRTLLSCSYPYSKRGNLRTCSSISRIHIITHRRSTVRMYHQIIEQTFIQIEITLVESSYFSTHPPSAKLCCHQRFASISFFLPFIRNSSDIIPRKVLFFPPILHFSNNHTYIRIHWFEQVFVHFSTDICYL